MFARVSQVHSWGGGRGGVVGGGAATYAADDFVVGVHFAAEAVGLRVLDLWRLLSVLLAGGWGGGGRACVSTSISRKFSGGP